MKKLWLVIIMCLLTGMVSAELLSIPEEGGLSGYVNVGASWLKVRTNSFVGTRMKTLGSETNSSLFNKPDSERTLTPMFNGELSYTFADSRTQLFAGNSMEDWLRLDLATALGVRQELPDKSILAGSFLFSAIPTEVWEDPFVTGDKRDETDRTSAGGRIAWGRLFGTTLQLQYSYRDIDIDDELSGESVGLLTSAGRARLDRNGHQHRTEVMYTWKIAENQWLSPRLRYDRNEMDGEAMANDSYDMTVTHVCAGATCRLVTNLSVGYAEYDGNHPVFVKEREDYKYGVSTTLFYPNFLNNPNLMGNVGVGYWRQNSNMAFYDDEIIAVSVGTTYTF